MNPVVQTDVLKMNSMTTLVNKCNGKMVVDTNTVGENSICDGPYSKVKVESHTIDWFYNFSGHIVLGNKNNPFCFDEHLVHTAILLFRKISSHIWFMGSKINKIFIISCLGISHKLYGIDVSFPHARVLKQAKLVCFDYIRLEFKTMSMLKHDIYIKSPLYYLELLVGQIHDTITCNELFKLKMLATERCLCIILDDIDMISFRTEQIAMYVFKELFEERTQINKCIGFNTDLVQEFSEFLTQERNSNVYDYNHITDVIDVWFC